MSSGQVPLGNASRNDLHWKTPSTWQELKPTSVRIGNFAISGENGKKAEVAITSFPGTVGTELDNVNRWRRELSLPEATESQISSEPISVGGADGKLYDLSSASARTVVADVMRDGSSWFFKLKGDADVVASARPVFLDFLKSVEFTGPSADLTSATADPHAGLNMAMQEEVGTPASPDAMKWNPPGNWQERPSGPMILKSFSVDDGNGPAVVTISSFPGDVGGVLANVNRWRGQLGLAPITEDALPAAVESLDLPDAKATVVNLTGTDAKTSQPSHMLAVIVPHAGQTWFYKLMGDGATVSKEKDAFLKFVQSVQYR